MDLKNVTLHQNQLKRLLLKLLFRKYFSFKRLSILLILLLFIGIQYDFRFMLYGFLLYTMFYFVNYLNSLSNSKKLTDLRKSETTFKISETNDGLKLESEQCEKKIMCRLIERVSKIENYLLVCLLDDSVVIIPTSSFTDKEMENSFIELINNGIIAARGSLKVSLFLKPPYFLGILCFIPVLGVLVGITLIFLGIFQYKNRILIMLGIIGIVFTFVLYMIWFPPIWNKNERDKQITGLSQTFLNNLVKDIELYKLQHGHYPEKLELLQSPNTIIMIIDPLQSEKNKDAVFNYSVIGDKYTVFSSGIDGIPKTEDDIYPQLSDTLKTGFTKLQ